MTRAPSIEPTRRVKIRSGIEAVLISTPVALLVGAIAGALLFWAIAPECKANEWFCGFDEALWALTVGGAVGLGIYVWLALRLVRGSLPVGHRSSTTAAVVVAFPVVVLVLPMLGAAFGF